MFNMSWEATYGYGDVLGGYCSVSKMAQEEKNVSFEWLWYEDRPWFPPDKKYHPNDPETVYERFLMIKDFVDVPDNITFSEKILPPYVGPGGDRPRYFNRGSIAWHRGVYKMKEPARDDGHVAVWTSKTNVDDYRTHTLRFWKHPFKNEFYDDYIEKIKKQTGKKVIHVDYRMPVKEVFDIIRTSSFCFGNDGIGNVIAKNYFKPMIVTIHGNYDIARSTSGEWVYWIDGKNPITIIHSENINSIIELQKYEIEEHRSRCY